MRFVFALVFLILAFRGESAIIYVNNQVFPSGNGTSWSSPYTFLYEAIDNASANDEIWVAEGAHPPYFGDPNDDGFLLPQGLKIFGGFKGTETLRNQRDWANNVTSLSGNPGVLNQEDYFHTLFNLEGSGIVIDGFTITNTYSEVLGAEYTTAGVFRAVEPNNVDAIIRHCIFENNISGYSAIAWDFDGDLEFINCAFQNNGSGNNHMIEVQSDHHLRIENCSFTNNSATGLTAGIAGNTGDLPTVEIYNSIVYGNDMSISLPSHVTGSHVLIDLPYTGTGISNIVSGDPMFAGPNDQRLKVGSAAMDAGDDSFITAGKDLGGLGRIYGQSVDLGAYEKHYRGRIYVDADAAGSNDGTSWLNAYSDLNNALLNASEEDTLWIAEGTYKPSLSDRYTSFELPLGVSLFGGFDGTETNLSQRDWKSHKTTLSGNIGNLNDSTDNSIHVVTLVQRVANHIYQVSLDGLIIRDGHAFDSTATSGDTYDLRSGAGCRFYLPNYYLNVVTNLSNCVIAQNAAHSDGGGLLIVGPLNMINCELIGNTAIQGSALKADYQFYMEGCLVINNTSKVDVLALYGLDVDILNCTFVDNTSYDSSITLNPGNLIHSNGSCTIQNSLFYGNQIASGYFFDAPSSVLNCIVQPEYLFPGIDSIDCITEIPTFISELNNDYRLCLNSVGIDAGASYPLLSTHDLNGTARQLGAGLEIGAFETDENDKILIYVNQDATGNNNGKSWANAYTDLQTALNSVECMAEIWVAEGLYKPTTTNDRDIAFEVPADTKIFGGFDGTETVRTQRNWALNKTIFSGAIGNQTDITDNSKKLIHILDAGSEVLIDGFEFRRVYSIEGEGYVGGAIHCEEGDLSIRHCNFNLNTGFAASALAISNGTAVIDNCLLFDNHIAEGGQISSITSPVDIAIRNSTFSKNTHDDQAGHEVHVYSGSTASAFNTIFWDNINFENVNGPSLDHCIIQGGGSGSLVLDIDPLFSDAAANDFTLLPESPGIDIGLDAPTLDFDLANNPAVQGLLPDLGCFESSSCASVNDECTGLIILNVNEEPLFSTNKCASAGNDQLLSCSQSNGNSVWYGFTAPAEGAVRIIVDNVIPISNSFNVKIGLFDNNCSNLEEISCENSSGSGLSETLDVLGVQPGTPFRIRIEGVDQQIGFFDIRIESLDVGCQADFNNDGSFSSVDLLLIIGELGCSAGCFTDINNDGSVSIGDLLAFFSFFGGNCD
ncbi:MAG: hypothetical protein GC193_03840 [Cryomorphaceae bacterium]|nr:hypothetical protein [Cryomorphaceae bacterium]